MTHSGDPAAQRNLAHLHRMGLGVAQDFVQAVSWYLRYPLSYRDIKELFLKRGLEVGQDET